MFSKLSRVWSLFYQYPYPTLSCCFILIIHLFSPPQVQPYYSTYGQLPTNQYYQTTSSNLPYLTTKIFASLKSQNMFVNNFISTGSSLLMRILSGNVAKPRRFQRLISNSLDQYLEQELGRSFKYELHPEEKLSLAILDWSENTQFICSVFCLFWVQIPNTFLSI